MELIMTIILKVVITATCVYAAYKMAIDKKQNKLGWTIGAFLFGPVPVVIQYIISDITKIKSVDLDESIKP